MEKVYECCVSLGGRKEKNRKLLWPKSAKWVGDSIVVEFSPEQCFVSEDLASAVSNLVSCAKDRRCKQASVCWGQVVDVGSLDDEAIFARKYEAFLRRCIDLIGIERYRDLCLEVGLLSAPDQEVSE